MRMLIQLLQVKVRKDNIFLSQLYVHHVSNQFKGKIIRKRFLLIDFHRTFSWIDFKIYCFFFFAKWVLYDFHIKALRYVDWEGFWNFLIKNHVNICSCQCKHKCLYKKSFVLLFYLFTDLFMYDSFNEKHYQTPLAWSWLYRDKIVCPSVRTSFHPYFLMSVHTSFRSLLLSITSPTPLNFHRMYIYYWRCVSHISDFIWMFYSFL